MRIRTWPKGLMFSGVSGVTLSTTCFRVCVSLVLAWAIGVKRVRFVRGTGLESEHRFATRVCIVAEMLLYGRRSSNCLRVGESSLGPLPDA